MVGLLDSFIANIVQADEASRSEDPIGSLIGSLEPAPTLPEASTDLDLFSRTIKENETPGNIYGEGFVRTGLSPKRHKELYGQTYRGSTAFGPHQITGILLDEGFRKKTFDKDTVPHAKKLRQLARYASKFGGSDRKKYEKGSKKRGEAVKVAKTLGFKDADEMLKAFDYGGDFGTNIDPTIKESYSKVSSALLKDALKGSGGDMEKAALRWHGGDTSSHLGRFKNQRYVDKFRTNLGKVRDNSQVAQR